MTGAAIRADEVSGRDSSDWSPTGSKNLLGELKVAWLHSQQALNGLFSARDIVAMATRDAAHILKWEKVVGTIEPGRRADLLVIDGTTSDPYEALIRAKETAIRLVMINGVARYGVPDVVQHLAPADQTLRVGGQMRHLFLEQQTGDPDVGHVALSTATSRLRTAFRDIAKLAKETEQPKRARAIRRVLDARVTPVWTLALDEIDSAAVDFGPRLPFNGPRDFTGAERAPRVSKAAPPLSTILKPVELDPLTVADDETFLSRMRTSRIFQRR